MQAERPDEGDNARAAGHTRRPLVSESSTDDSAEVLGNELEARQEAEDEAPRT